MTSTEWMAVLIAALVLLGILTLIVVRFRSMTRPSGAPDAANQTPEGLSAPMLGVEGEYISTTPSGRPFERIQDQGLGFKALGALDLHREGLLVLRTGAEDLFIPAQDIVSVERTQGQAGKFVEPKGLIAVTWLLRTQLVVTAFRARYSADTQRFIDAASTLYPHLNSIPAPASTRPASQEFDDHE